MLATSKIDDTITESSVPDPDLSDLDVFGPHIVIRPVRTKEVTKGGLILPDQVRDDINFLSNVGRVLKTGPYVFKGSKFEHGVYHDGTPLSVGDYVIIGKHAGESFKFKGVHLKFILDTHIKFRVGNPSDLDTSFNLDHA